MGATPRFVDVLPDTLLIDPDAAAAAVGPRTAAIIAVHLFGQMADMSALSALADRHGLALIEDAAQAHGARFAGRRAGSWRRGGHLQLLPRQEPRRARRRRRRGVRRRRRWSPGSGGWPTTAGREIDRYAHEVAGRNSRLDTLQAAVAAGQAARPGRGEPGAGGRWSQRYRAGAAVLVRPGRGAPARRAGLPPRRGPGARTATAATRALDDAGIGWGIHYPVPVPPPARVRPVRRWSRCRWPRPPRTASCRCRCSRP